MAKRPFRQQPNASLVVTTLERVWYRVQHYHPDLPAAVIVIASGSEGSRLKKWGHWAALRWRVMNGKDVGEVLIAGERLRGGAEAVLETLLHEAAHALAFARKIEDTSRNGRYHNRRYKALAEEVGLAVEQDERYGFTLTSLISPTKSRYRRQVQSLDAACRTFRHEVNGTGYDGTKGGRILVECRCPAPRRLRVSPAVATVGPILCGLCNKPFEPL